MNKELIYDSAGVVSMLGRGNSVLLLQVVKSLNELRDLLLEYSPYAVAFSDAITDALNRRIMTNSLFRKWGVCASVLYTADEESKLCSMEFEGDCNGRFYFYYAVGESEEENTLLVGLEEGTNPEFVQSMLEALWVAQGNLYEQLMAVKGGFGYLTVEPKKPN